MPTLAILTRHVGLLVMMCLRVRVPLSRWCGQLITQWSHPWLAFVLISSVPQWSHPWLAVVWIGAIVLMHHG